VWVGAAGSATGWGVVQSVRERWPDATIVAADSNPRHRVAAAADADAFAQVPVATDAAFGPALATALAEHRIDVYVPIHDLELIAAARLREAGALPAGVACTAPSLAAAELCWDKLAVADALEAAGLPAARTAPGADAWIGPCVAKPRRGVGSRGVRVLDDGALRTDDERGDGYVVQERCDGPEVTVDAFRSRDGRVAAALCRERVATRGGVATTGRLFADAELEALAERLADAVGLRGAFCFQVMRPAGQARGWRITDVNPRVGGATRMSVAVGFDVHAAMLADAWGEDPAPYLARPDGERWVTRGYVERVTGP
jgi:carbamoyl-phosphate synthase large subunit